VKTELTIFSTPLKDPQRDYPSRERALAVAGIAVGKIFDAHLMILDDPVFYRNR